ncbi:MAG: DoxX family protein [Spirochaetes bacterium]|nr:DoxX family protein [Spirochaetota bacterium]
MIRIFDYAIRIVIAIVLLQTLWFKFRAAPESVAIFTALHAEPWGRIAAGVVELAASVLLFLPRAVIFGAGLTLGTMLGAVLAHIFVIGIAVRGDGGRRGSALRDLRLHPPGRCSCRTTPAKTLAGTIVI